MTRSRSIPHIQMCPIFCAALFFLLALARNWFLAPTRTFTLSLATILAVLFTSLAPSQLLAASHRNNLAVLSQIDRARKVFAPFKENELLAGSKSEGSWLIINKSATSKNDLPGVRIHILYLLPKHFRGVTRGRQRFAYLSQLDRELKWSFEDAAKASGLLALQSTASHSNTQPGVRNNRTQMVGALDIKDVLHSDYVSQRLYGRGQSESRYQMASVFLPDDYLTAGQLKKFLTRINRERRAIRDRIGDYMESHNFARDGSDPDDILCRKILEDSEV